MHVGYLYVFDKFRADHSKKFWRCELKNGAKSVYTYGLNLGLPRSWQESKGGQERQRKFPNGWVMHPDLACNLRSASRIRDGSPSHLGNYRRNSSCSDRAWPSVRAIRSWRPTTGKAQIYTSMQISESGQLLRVTMNEILSSTLGDYRIMFR